MHVTSAIAAVVAVVIAIAATVFMRERRRPAADLVEPGVDVERRDVELHPADAR
jgi:ABC-type phosphate transport system permease subunit